MSTFPDPVNAPNPSALLMGGGSKSFKFENPGDQVVGTIAALKVTQQTDLDGKPKTWDNGDPRWQLVVTLQTELREDGDDDGKRNIYVKGGKKSPTTEKAIADAITAAGATEILVGGKLAVAFTGVGEPTKPGLSAPKQYVAQYQAPVQGVNMEAIAPPADVSAAFGQPPSVAGAPAFPAAPTAPPAVAGWPAAS